MVAVLVLLDLPLLLGHAIEANPGIGPNHIWIGVRKSAAEHALSIGGAGVGLFGG